MFHTNSSCKRVTVRTFARNQDKLSMHSKCRKIFSLATRRTTDGFFSAPRCFKQRSRESGYMAKRANEALELHRCSAADI